MKKIMNLLFLGLTITAIGYLNFNLNNSAASSDNEEITEYIEPYSQKLTQKDMGDGTIRYRIEIANNMKTNKFERVVTFEKSISYDYENIDENIPIYRDDRDFDNRRSSFFYITCETIKGDDECPIGNQLNIDGNTMLKKAYITKELPLHGTFYKNENDYENGFIYKEYFNEMDFFLKLEPQTAIAFEFSTYKNYGNEIIGYNFIFDQNSYKIKEDYIGWNPYHKEKINEKNLKIIDKERGLKVIPEPIPGSQPQPLPQPLPQPPSFGPGEL